MCLLRAYFDAYTRHRLLYETRLESEVNELLAQAPVLGAGAAFAAVALVADVPGADELALWLLLAGSVGLIAFDRRAKRCLAETQCPIETQGDKLG